MVAATHACVVAAGACTRTWDPHTMVPTPSSISCQPRRLRFIVPPLVSTTSANVCTLKPLRMNFVHSGSGPAIGGADTDSAAVVGVIAPPMRRLHVIRSVTAADKAAGPGSGWWETAAPDPAGGLHLLLERGTPQSALSWLCRAVDSCAGKRNAAGLNSVDTRRM
eukprot:357014-Chlamydomonas_euryale.AAC.6